MHFVVDHWTMVKDLMTLGVALAAAVAGLSTYRNNARTRRAEFLLRLHKDFFVEEKYRAIRQLIDSEDEPQQRVLAEHLARESEELIEYLNFFELTAYLADSETLAFKDITALLRYYLWQLRSKPELRA